MTFPVTQKAGTIVRHIELPSSRHLILVNNDLLSEPVDCIVNPANGGLSHGGGLAAQIAIAAGEALENEGSEIVKNKGRIPTGQAVATNAGNLKFKGVIHAIGPCVGQGNELELLVSAIYNSLVIANENDWSSISIPGISSGIFSVPLEICSKGYILGIIKLLREFPETNLKIIRICLLQGKLLDLVSQEIDKRKEIFREL
ncbi:MAG: O-acetyl-ADP-ribose deacetylase [bacterium ADurb.Bin374]|nr:MAG: O-acetyl-ADP-ribose deacetylase [bacterium ADurb.Bin374]